MGLISRGEGGGKGGAYMPVDTVAKIQLVPYFSIKTHIILQTSARLHKYYINAQERKELVSHHSYRLSSLYHPNYVTSKFVGI